MPNYGINSSASKTCFARVFCYLDFRSYLKADYPKSLPLALESTFAFGVCCKKHLPTPKTTAKQPSTLIIDGKGAVTSNYCTTSWRTPSDIYKNKSCKFAAR